MLTGKKGGTNMKEKKKRRYNKGKKEIIGKGGKSGKGEIKLNKKKER